MPRDFLPSVNLVRPDIRGLPLPFDLIHLRAVIEAPQRQASVDSFRQRGEDRSRGQNNGRYVKPIPGSRNGSHNFLQHRGAFARRECNRYRHAIQSNRAGVATANRGDDLSMGPKALTGKERRPVKVRVVG